jgi:hypothetical protein
MVKGGTKGWRGGKREGIYGRLEEIKVGLEGSMKFR